MNRPMPRTTLLHRTPIIVSLAILLSTAALIPTGSAGCVDYSNIMHAIGRTQITQGAVAVVVSGNYAYTAKRSLGFQVLDVSSPNHPQIVGSVTTDYATDVALSDYGPYAYVADRYSIKVVDISNPTTPTIVGQLTTPDGAYRLAASGSHVFVADGDYGVRVIDVSNPQAPTFVTALDTFGSAAAIAISGSYAYVADNSDGLLVLDISNPLSPQIVGSVVTPEWAEGVSVLGSYAYVIDGPWVHVIGISNPAAPAIIATINGLSPRNLFPVGSRLYAIGGQGLGVVDVSTPAAPVTLGLTRINGGGDDIFVRGSYAYVVEVVSQYFDVFDITQGFSPTFPTVQTGGTLAASGNYVYTNSAGTFNVVDVSNPNSPVITGSTSVGTAGRIAVQGSYAYVCASSLYVVDISNPNVPTVVGILSTSGNDIAVSGSYVYLAFNGIRVVDVSNPTAPLLVGSSTVSGLFLNIAVSGNTAYVTGDVNGHMAIFNVSNPASPTPMGTASITGPMTISGSYMFNVPDAYTEGGVLRIYSGLSLVGSVPGLGTPYSKPIVSGSFAYLATDARNVHAIDISNVTSPQDLGILSPPAGANQLVASASNVYVTNGGTLSVLPIQCVNNFPIAQDPGTQNGIELTFFSVTVTASDPDKDPLAMSPIGPLPAWAVFSDVGGGTALLRGTPQIGQAGTYPISIRTSDGKAADTTSFNIVIAPALATINLESSGFAPGTAAIRAGASVKWVKAAGGNHSTTNGTGPLDPAAGTLWDAQLRATSPQFTRAFPTAGTFPYFCRIHPSETGTITVSAAQTGIDESDSHRLRFAVSPNPFRTGVNLQFDLERDGHVSVVILDLQGRKVRNLVTGEFPAGTHRASWEGRDELGHPVAQGLYFARLTTEDGRVKVQKLFKTR